VTTRWPQRRRADPVDERPRWVRVFVADEWRDPDEDARWPADTLDWHAERRWCVARTEWLAGNPAAAGLESAELAAYLAEA
jgi:hypothetical protein